MFGLFVQTLVLTIYLLTRAPDVLKKIFGLWKPSMLAGFVGAIGDSAGPAGVPFLAQSVWVLTSDITAFNASTQPHWAMLVEQLGFDANLAVPLCVLALGGTLARQGQKDFQTLTAATKAT